MQQRLRFWDQEGKDRQQQNFRRQQHLHTLPFEASQLRSSRGRLLATVRYRNLNIDKDLMFTFEFGPLVANDVEGVSVSCNDVFASVAGCTTE